MTITERRIAQSTLRPDQRFVDEAKPTISFRIGRALLKEVDELAARRGQRRSRLIEEALRLFLTFHSSFSASENRDAQNGQSDAAD